MMVLPWINTLWMYTHRAGVYKRVGGGEGVPCRAPPVLNRYKTEGLTVEFSNTKLNYTMVKGGAWKFMEIGNCPPVYKVFEWIFRTG